MMKKFDHINVRITPHIDFVFCSIWYYGTELSPKKKKTPVWLFYLWIYFSTVYAIHNITSSPQNMVGQD